MSLALQNDTSVNPKEKGICLLMCDGNAHCTAFVLKSYVEIFTSYVSLVRFSVIVTVLLSF